jgi:nitrogenase molybdenum-cofactor synthesis protein NifE
MKVLKERDKQILTKGKDAHKMVCEKPSLAGSVSQRACVFCGSRVVLYPIADALHLVHGPLGCAAYTWDIRGALSSGPELHRNSFCTDLREKDVIFGGEKKLEETLEYYITKHQPKAAFVYATCIVGIIGDDVGAIAKKVSKKTGVPVIPVHSEGFKGTKKDGYKAACEALLKLVAMDEELPINEKGQKIVTPTPGPSINILGEFNLAGETWMLKEYYEKMGVQVVSVATGDGRVGEIMKSHTARLNVVQCSGSMTSLAKMMEKEFGIPYIRVSYFGIEDMSDSLYRVAEHFSDHPQIMENTKSLVRDELAELLPSLEQYRKDLKGKKAAVYVGGAFKAISLVKALGYLGMKVILAGSQTGTSEDYEMLAALCDKDTVLVDDSNPVELTSILLKQGRTSLSAGSKSGPWPTSWGSASATTTTNGKSPWRVIWG